MLEWWEGLSLVSRILVCIAVPATAVMLLQAILVLLGLGGGDGDLDGDIGGDMSEGFDVDFDGEGEIALEGSAGFEAPDGDGTGDPAENDGLALFSIRGIVAFFSIGGWAGLVADRAGIVLPGVVSISVVAGAIALFGVAWIMQKAMQLQEDGTLELKHALGKTATVYLPVPPKGQGKGKVELLFSESLVEVDAVSSGDRQLPTGAQVTVCALADATTLVVQPLVVQSAAAEAQPHVTQAPLPEQSFAVLKKEE